MKKWFVLSSFLLTAALLANGDPKVCLHQNPECLLINKWFDEQTAAGNTGDYYDNRDREHSLLAISTYPQITSVTYTLEDRSHNLDWGTQKIILKNVTIGNSSTSADVRGTGSNVRSVYYTYPIGLDFLYREYRFNNLYIYPSHWDYIPGHNGHYGYGDLYPTNSPYVIISKGDSGTDQPFLNSFFHTLASFRPEVKEKLIKRGLLMPTLQLIFRASNRNIKNWDDYLTGAAHPAVFDGNQVDTLRMVKAAHDIQLDTIPPFSSIEVLSEDLEIDKNYFKVDGSEILGNTPNVISRIFRGPSYTKRIVVGAKNSADINYKPLTYHWVVLQGDPNLVKITPINDGTAAEIDVSYQDRHPIAKGSLIESNRIDIGLFVHNGTSYSAPSFITYFTLDNEGRTYDKGKLIEIYFNVLAQNIEVADWIALLEMIKRTNSNLATTLLKRSFMPKEIDTFDGTMEALSKPYAILEKLKEKEKSLKDEEQKAYEKARYMINEIVEAKSEAFEGQSLKEKMTEIFTAIRQDQNLYVNHVEEIQKWLDVASPEDLNLFNQMRARLIKLGILKETAKNQWVVEGMQHLSKNSEGFLTKYEKYQLDRFHLFILANLFYPKMLSYWESENYVDSRLTTPKAVRYVYRYNDEGKMVGWKRYSEDKVVEEHGL